MQPGHDLRLALRQATKAAHHHMDHHPLLARLLRGPVDAGAYGDALNALYCLHGPIETAFDRLVWHGDYPSPRRSQWLLQDLMALGRVPQGVMWPVRVPVSCSDYVGMRYVIEGSAMGARVIRQSFHGRLPDTCHTATRFFDGDPDDRGWSNLWALCAQYPLDQDAVVQGALTLFNDIRFLLDAHIRPNDGTGAGG